MLKRLILLGFVLCLTASISMGQVRNPVPRAVTGFEELKNVPFCPSRHHPHRDDADLVGERYEVGTTWYDYQSNGTLGKMIAVDEDGGIHVVWMKALDAQLADRHTYYNYIIDDEVQLEGGVEVDDADRAGYNNLGYAPDVGAIPIFHTQVGGGDNYWTNIAQDADLGEGEFEAYQNPREGGRNFVWPHGTVDRHGRSHVLSRIWPDANGVIDMQYVRGEPDEDEGWVFTDPVIAACIKGLHYTVAASRVEDNVALVYIGQSYDPDEEGNRWPSWAGGDAMCTDVFVIESENGEDFDWDNPYNATRCLRPDPDADHNSPFFQGDTLRPYLMIDACYDNDNNLHVVFCTGSMVENVDPNAARGWVRYDDRKCYVWHWDRESDEVHFVADGWWTPANNGQVGAWRMNISFPSIGVDEDDNLYCAFTLYPREGDLGAPAPNNIRYINGEIYVTVSTDGGRTWSVPVNVTDTNTDNERAGDCMSESWSSLAEVVNDYLHISYVLDTDPGGIPHNEGVPTESPFMYHRVPVDEIPPEPKALGRDFHVGWPPEIAVDPELPVIPGVPDGDPGEVELTISNTNEDGTGLYVSLRASEEIADLLEFDPSAMRIAPGEEEAVVIRFSPDEEGEFEGTIFLEHNAQNEDSPVEIEFHGIGVEGYGTLTGQVIDVSDGSPVPGARIALTPGEEETVSDEEGNYRFERVPAWNYQVACSAEDFLPFTGEVEVEVDQVAEYQIDMRFAMFELDVDRIESPVPTGEQFDQQFTAFNDGTGPVQFQAETVLPGGAGAVSYTHLTLPTN